MAGRKSDFTLPTLDDLFSTQELRDDAKLSKIRDIPLELIDDFPDHPFKVRDDEDILGTRFEKCVSCGTPIIKKGNRKKYCEKCAQRAYKAQQAEYARRKRAESKNRR